MLINSQHLVHHLCTDGFYLMDSFLDLNSYKSLCDLAEKIHHQGSFKSAKIGLNVGAQLNDAIRTDKICWLEEQSTERGVSTYLNQTKLIMNILNQSLFLGLDEFETHFAVYPPGAFYKKHVDQFKSEKNRKISCVYYLNEDWKEAYGGELKLYNQEGDLIQTVFPQGNRFICFKSQLPHEVCVTHQTRYSISGWMKTRPDSGLPWR